MARRVAREEYEQLCWMIKKWNQNRLELFEITLPNENLEFEGIMRFYFQSPTSDGQKVATKCIRVSNTANTDSVIEALVQKFRPDLRMLTSQSSYVLYEVHSNEDERRMEKDEYPLMVQLGWVNGEREGRFLLRRESIAMDSGRESERRLKEKRVTKRGKKVKKEREQGLEEGEGKGDVPGSIARSLYHVMPESKFTRSISVKNRKNLNHFSFHGAEDLEDNSTLRVYAGSLLPHSQSKSLLISPHDTAAQVVKSYLEKCGLREDPSEFCLLQVTLPQGRYTGSNPQLNVDYSERIVGDSERPLQLSNQRRGGETVQFHLRRKDSLLHQRHSTSHSHSRSHSPDEMDDPTLPALVEIVQDTHNLQRPRRFLLSADATEIGSNGALAASVPDPRGHLCLNSSNIKPRHCLIKEMNGTYTIAPLDKSAVIFVNNKQVRGCQNLEHNSVVRLGDHLVFRFFAPIRPLSSTAATNSLGWPHSSREHHQPVPAQNDISRAKSVENIRNPVMMEDCHQAASRKLRDRAFSEYDLKAQLECVDRGERERERERERRVGERKYSEPHVERSSSASKKRHLSAPQSTTTTAMTRSSEDQEWIPPASLSFHQPKEQLLLQSMIGEVNGYLLQFKLGPAYGLYLVAKHHLSPEFQPGCSGSERRKSVVLTLKSIGSHVKRAVKDSRSIAGALAFWLANTTELLHLLKQDYQLNRFSNDFETSLTQIIHLAYKHFVQCMIKEIQVYLPAFYDDSADADYEEVSGYASGSESALSTMGKEPDVVPASRPSVSRHASITGSYWSITGSKVRRKGRPTISDTLQMLNTTVTLLRRCRVNATLSIMIFSNLFRYISTKVFNRMVGGEVKHCGRSLGQKLCRRLEKVKAWAEREGMELPADEHLTMIVQAANLLQASKKLPEKAQSIFASCSHLNSLQVSTFLHLCTQTDGETAVNKTLTEELILLARAHRDEILRGEEQEVGLEEDPNPELIFHIPTEGYSSESVVGMPGGLQDFLQPMISAGLCKLTVIKECSGLWSPPIRHVTSSQSLDHSISPVTTSPQNVSSNTLPKMSRSHRHTGDNELTHSSTLPHHGHPGADLKVVKVTISKDSHNNTLGISIVAAKINPTSESGIFVKSMIEGGPAQLDGRLKPGDQILEVDGIDLQGSTQERATQVLRNTGKKVTLLVAKQAALFYGLTHVIQQPSPRYSKHLPEGSSHARKAARRQKRERQRQERYNDYRLERKKLDHHTEQHLSPSQLSDPRFPPHTNPQMAKWIREQNALHQSEKGSEVEAFGSTSSISNVAERDMRPVSPVPSFATSSSRPTRGSLERHLYRTGSPPVRDSSGPPSRQNDRHSPFDMLESYEGHTMSDTGSKFSDYSVEPEYNMPPKSAPPTNLHHRPSYKDAFNASLSSQPMANSLTPYSQQQNPSQQAHLDKLSMDVMYHTQFSGASLSGISSIVPQLQQAKGGRPYLGRVHLKELDGDEIDMEKQRIKLMFYEKQNQERALQEQGGATSPKQGSSSGGSRTGYPTSPLPRDFQSPPNLKEEAVKSYLDEGETSPNTTHLLQELETLEQLAIEQRRKYKEFRYARERESLTLRQAEVKFQEQELLVPRSLSMYPVHQEKWQKEQKRRLRNLERFRAEQKDKMQTLEAEEHRAKSKLKALETNILTLRQQLSERELGSRDSATGLRESHVPEAYHPDHLPAKLPPEYPPNSSVAGGARPFVDELQGLKDDQVFRPIDPEQAPEREWPKDVGSKSNPGRFISMESVNSSSLVGNEIPEFSREIVNTMSESTNMTEPTQDDPVPMKWPDKYSAHYNNPDDPYAGELQPKFSFSDDEFFMDEGRPREGPMDVPPMISTSEKVQQGPPYFQDYPTSRLPNGHGHHYLHQGMGGNVHAFDQPVNEVHHEAGKQPHRGQVWKQAAHHHHREKPQPHASGRVDHHYSRSNRPRHTRNTPYGADNTSTVSGITSTTARSNADYHNGDGLKVPDVVPMSAAISPSTIHTSSPPLVSGHPTGERNMSPLNRVMDETVPHSPSSIPPPQPSAYFPFREHPPQHALYAVPTSTGPSLYDVPKKSSTKGIAPVSIYDQPRPTSSPQHMSNHVPPQSPQSSYPPDSNRPPYHKVSDRGGLQQHYDVPKLASEQSRTVEREMRQAPSNPSPYPHQYHGLPTKPGGRSYSRGRQDVMGYSDRGFRGQHSRQAQRVQRQQTEL